MPVLAFAHEFNSVECADCGISFALPKHLHQRRIDDGKSFYCPNGHSNTYGETEVKRLQRVLDAERAKVLAEQKKREWAEQATAAEAKLREKAERRLKRNQTRIANGVCPCCNRHFTNLERHMKMKHPDAHATAKLGQQA